MGIFSIDEKESEKLRGFPDAELSGLPDDKLIMLALAIVMEAYQIEDAKLIGELKRRAANASNPIR
jgi:hypothetical protein